ncbi:MAG: Ca-activated chloride channel family protein [Bradymonadia bacterium]|jgi:Ca-activated chloride channel family protein
MSIAPTISRYARYGAVFVCMFVGSSCASETASHSEFGASGAYADASSGTSGRPTAPVDAVSFGDVSAAGDTGSPIDDQDTAETYEPYAENDFVDADADPLATFSVDVDSASYTIMRRDVLQSRLPNRNSVRLEEYLNFFDYDYPAPGPESEAPFGIGLESAPSEFGQGMHLLRVALQGDEVPAAERLPANLVFLIDVSGSMQSTDKLDLVQFSLKTLVKALGPDDTLGIVVYAGHNAILLEPTAVRNRVALYDAIDALSTRGGTAGEAGIRAAYDLAEGAFREGGINRIVLCTDGDFNVGLTGEPLLELIEEFRDRDITISTLGFGRGNYNDATMEQIADRGNGNYAFIDNRNEALRTLGTNVVGTLQVIAKDVKVQVEFNPEVVSRYRLVGYDNRVLEDWGFVDDTVDAAELGAGHNVTAFLEVELVDGVVPGEGEQEVAAILLRYKQPDGDVSTQVGRTFAVSEMGTDFEDASRSFRFAAAVTEFAEILRGSRHTDGERFEDIIRITEVAAFADHPDMQEFPQLVQIAAGL